MKEILLTQIVKPLIFKVGTATGALLVANNIDATLATQIETGVIALGLVGLDLYFGRNKN